MWRKLLLKTDIFADRFGLNIDGEQRFRTKIGATFSLMYVLILVAIFVQQMNKYFDKINPVTTVQGYTSDLYPRIQLKEEMQLPFFVGYFSDTEYLPLDKLKYYVSLKSNRHSWFTTKLPDGSVHQRRIITNFVVKPCRELTEIELRTYGYISNSSIAWSIFLKYGMCIALTDNLAIEGKGIDPLMETGYFHVKPCALPIKEKCVSQTEVEDFNFRLFRPTANFNASNYKYPYYRIPNADDIFYLSIKNKQIMTVQLIKNKVYDLIGLKAEWKQTHIYYEAGPPLISLQNRNEDSIYCPPANSYGPDGSGCSSYFSFNLRSSGHGVVRKRAYTTLSETLGIIGGISGILSMVFTLVYGYINEKRRDS